MAAEAVNTPSLDIVVMDVWHDPLAGIGETVMKHPGRARRVDLRKAAIKAARSEIRARLPIEVGEPVIGGRLRRGPRLPDGQRHAFVEWTVGHPSLKLRRAAEHALLKLQSTSRHH